MDGGKMQPPSSQGSSHPTNLPSRKRQNLTLDLNSAAVAKRNKVQSLLTSPDVQRLKLSSPELEKFLSQNPSLATPTPNGYLFPKSVTEEQIMYAKGFEEALNNLRQSEGGSTGSANTNTATSTTTTSTTRVDIKDDDKEASVAAANTLVTLGNSAISIQKLQRESQPLDDTVNFSSAASNVHLPLSISTTDASSISAGGDGLLPRPSSVASGASFDSSEGGVKIKDEPDDNGSLSGGEYSSGGSLLSPPNQRSRHQQQHGLSPIDMDNQEKIKLERKRQRNRYAAAKCRKRKLEKISQLDDRVQQLKTENADLAAVVKKMKSSVALLKQEVIEHVNSGCDIRITDATNLP